MGSSLIGSIEVVQEFERMMEAIQTPILVKTVDLTRFLGRRPGCRLFPQFPPLWGPFTVEGVE